MDQPFAIGGVVLNPKCAVISAVTVALYYTCPTRDSRYATMTAAAIAVATYVGVAHYDERYECKRGRLLSRGGVYSQTIGSLKPPVHPIKGTYSELKGA